VKDAFQQQGFGTLTEIDVKHTMHEKLGEIMEPFVILGVCNPNLAHRALDVTRDVGLLLPCTVVVRAHDDHVLVQALDPRVIAAIVEDEELEPIATEAWNRVEAALAALVADETSKEAER
jgi:uncharacterized protein (DUF302 family)